MIPILYESQYISIQTLWVFVAIALVSGSYLAVQRLKRSRVNFTLFIEHSTFFFLTAIVFSRVVYFFLNYYTYLYAFDFRTLKNFFSIWDQGFSFWGAFIGFMVALLYRLRRSEENIWKWLDALVVPLIIGMGISSVGSFLSGYSYGRPTDLFWGVRYELANVKYTVPIHPVQIYTLLFLVAVLYSKRQIMKRSEFFEHECNASLYYATALSFGFFVLEFFRGDDTLLIQGIRLPTLFFVLGFMLSGRALYKRYLHFKHPKHESV